MRLSRPDPRESVSVTVVLRAHALLCTRYGIHSDTIAASGVLFIVPR